MIVLSVALLGIAIICAFIGWYVLFQAPSEASHQAFCIFASGIALWISGYSLTILTRTDVFLPLLNSGGLLLVIGLTRFAQVYPHKAKLRCSEILFWAPLMIGGSMLVCSRLIIEHVHVYDSGRMDIIHGPLVGVWSLLLFVYIGISIYFFTCSYKTQKGEQKERLRLIFISFGIFALCALLFDAILPGEYNIIRLNIIGPVSSLLIIFTISYCLLTHGFLNVRIVLQRSLIYTLSFFVLALIYTLLLVFFESLSEHLMRITAPAAAGITILVGMYSLPRMEKQFRKVTDPWFFKDTYNYAEVLEELSYVLNSFLNLRTLARESTAVLSRTFKPAYVYFIRTGTLECFSHEECFHNSTAGTSAMRIVISSNNIPIGEYILGPKKSGDAYSIEDQTLLRTFSIQATVAFEKAELHQTLQEHTEQLEDKVMERTKYLQEIQSQQKDFFDDISHALQTPVTVVMSGIELLKKSLPSASYAIYSNIDASISQLSHLITSILTLARLDTEPTEEEMSTVDLSDCILACAEYVGLIAEAKNIICISSIEPDIAIYGNARQIQDLCTNVLSNAIKYTAECDVRNIQITLYRQAASAILRVSDSGIGMSSEQINKICYRFYRAPDFQNTRSGYGLGLAITKRIIERHHGSILFTSSIGEGTSVIITLPCTVSGAQSQ